MEANKTLILRRMQLENTKHIMFIKRKLFWSSVKAAGEVVTDYRDIQILGERNMRMPKRKDVDKGMNLPIGDFQW